MKILSKPIVKLEINLQKMNGHKFKNNDLSIDLHVLDIDASIKVGNPGIALNEEGLRIADNYPVILL
jgi:hypothetical protein